MDLWKFLDMLDNETLYLSRADKFKDTFEGRIPIRKVRQLDKDDFLKRLDDFSESSLTKSTYISSWTAEENETFPLWKIYSDYCTAVGVKTTVQKIMRKHSG